MVTTTEEGAPPSAPPSSGGLGGQVGHFAVEIEHKVKQLSNEAKEEGVPIVGHTLEGLDNVGDGGGGALDPFAQLFTSGFGWIIDSVSFLREPIEKLDGDAAAVQTAVDAMRTITENLTYVAHGHREDIPSLDDWQGEAAEAYRTSMQLLHEEILSLGKVVEGLGTLTAVSGAMVITLRKIVRELVATAVGSICIIMAAAAAAAFFTFGASIGVGIAASVAAAIAVMVESTRRITMLKEALGRQTGRMGELEGIAEDITKNLERFEKTTGGSGTTKRLVPSRPNRGEGGPSPTPTMTGEFTEAARPVEKPKDDPNEKNPQHWDDLRDRADDKAEESHEQFMREFFAGNREQAEEAHEQQKEWERIRDDAEARSEEASSKLEEDELEQAKKEFS
jgi:hypothetical protein